MNKMRTIRGKTEDYYLYETIRSSYDKDFKKLIETINGGKS